jgi:hypothetical protein
MKLLAGDAHPAYHELSLRTAWGGSEEVAR